MIRTPICAVMLCLALAACGDKPNSDKPAEMAQALPNLPLPPDPTFVQKSAGPEAVQLTVETPAKPEAVLAYYRDVFKKGSWRLVKEGKDELGATVLLAEQDGPPLWVRVRPSGATGSVVELSGAVVPKAGTPTATTKPAS
jgi:hypothetical protein